MDEIIRMAQRLGRAIADCPQAKALEEARKVLHADAATVQTLKDYEAQENRVAQLESQQKPVEVEDKHKLEDLRGKLMSAETFKKYTAAQVEFVDVMRKVNQTIHGEMAPAEK